MISTAQAVAIVLVTAAVTLLTRLLPFAVFGSRPLPKAIRYLGSILPAAIIAVLVIYCLKSVDLAGGIHGLPELLSVALTAGLHVWKKNNLLSIGAGTVCYMVLVQLVFV